MKLILRPILFVLIILQFELYAVKGTRSRNENIEEQQYLFPGTGFFIKDRSPYGDNEAKKYF